MTLENYVDRCECRSALHRERWDAFEAAHSRWPSVELRFQRFSQHLDALGYELELPAEPSSVFLCLACGLGNDAACDLLDALHFPALRVRVGRIYSCKATVDDILQLVRHKLIVGPSPRIHAYDGRGSLRGWLLRVATNVTLDFRRADTSHLRRHRRWMDKAGAAQLEPPIAVSPEDDLISNQCAPIVEAALAKALRTLPNEDRALLRHHFISGFGIDTLGRLYSIDRSTAARRILRNLARVRGELRKELTQQLEPGELESCLPVLYTRLEFGPDLLSTN